MKSVDDHTSASYEELKMHIAYQTLFASRRMGENPLYCPFVWHIASRRCPG